METLTNRVHTVLYTICKSLVDQGHKLEINISQPSYSTLIAEIICEKEDMGILIGKGGRIIDALRLLVRAVVRRDAAHTIVEIRDSRN